MNGERRACPSGSGSGSGSANAAAIVLLALMLAGCGERREAPAGDALAGDPENGRLLLRQYGCGGCHRIDGVAGAIGRVGPPLDAFSKQVYVAGVLPNTRADLVRWIVDPQVIQPGSAMPDLGVSEQQARDMAAYLHALD